MGLIAWQLFVTLTFARDGLSSRIKITSFFAFVRELSSFAGVPFESCLWMLRVEAGEAGGRIHMHALIAGLPEKFCSIANCFRLQCVWDHEVDRRAPNYGGKKLKMGMARIRKYDASLDGVAYCLKGLKGVSGADAYEFSKFSGDDAAVTLSNSLLAHFRLRCRHETRSVRGHRERRHNV